MQHDAIQMSLCMPSITKTRCQLQHGAWHHLYYTLYVASSLLMGVWHAFCRFIIMEADTTLSPWSKICISHADCILLVGTPDASPEVSFLILCIFADKATWQLASICWCLTGPAWCSYSVIVCHCKAVGLQRTWHLNRTDTAWLNYSFSKASYLLMRTMSNSVYFVAFMLTDISNLQHKHNSSPSIHPHKYCIFNLLMSAVAESCGGGIGVGAHGLCTPAWKHAAAIPSTA